MSYIFENGNSNSKLHKEINNSNYFKWMNLILRRSEEIGKIELPIYSVILDERGRCIGRGFNRRNIHKDPLGHAELIALKQASLIKNDWRFNDCTLIVNFEPCPMCAGALIQARMGKIIYGSVDPKRGALGGTINLAEHKSAHHKTFIEGGVMEEESRKLIVDWFKDKRCAPRKNLLSKLG